MDAVCNSEPSKLARTMMLHQQMSRRRSDLSKHASLTRGAISFAASIVFLVVSCDDALARSRVQLAQSRDVSNFLAFEHSGPPADTVVLRFKQPASVSIRDQHIYTSVLYILLRDRVSQQPDVRRCRLTVLSNDQFPDLNLTLSHANPLQRDDCLRGTIRYVLHEPVGEADFLAARETKAEEIRQWTESVYPNLAVNAATRLAYLAIYWPNSPLHQLSSVARADIADLSFDSFTRWLLRNRQDRLIAFDAPDYLLQILELPPKQPSETAVSIPMSSPRAPSGTLFFDGERFGIPALIMMSLDPKRARRGRMDDDIWKRVCNQNKPPHFGGDAIFSIRCSSHFYFATDYWLVLAVTRAGTSDIGSFCRQVRDLVDHPHMIAVVRDTPEESRGVYVMLPSQCTKQE